LAGVAAEMLEARLRVSRAEALAAEKDLLAREADHRVANGLQLIHGALSLQAAAEPNAVLREALQLAAGRVMAVAGAHRHLHRAVTPPDAGGVPDAVAYLATLVRDLAPSGVPAGVAGRPVLFHAAPDAGVAMPAGLLPRLGLIAAELVANALKHGRGRVLVELLPAALAEGGGVVLAVSDEGPGFPPGFDPHARGRQSLGIRLVATLSRPAGVWIDPEDRRRIVVRLVNPAMSSAFR
jgi:two-component sensor histidine kinase